MIQNRNVFLYAQNAIDPIEQIDFSNSTILFSTNNLTSTDIAGYSPSGSGSFSEIGSGDFSGSGSGDGEFASYQPLTCSAPNGIKSEAITRKFRHLMQNIYKARLNIQKWGLSWDEPIVSNKKPTLIIDCVLSTLMSIFFRIIIFGCDHRKSLI